MSLWICHHASDELEEFPYKLSGDPVGPVGARIFKGVMRWKSSLTNSVGIR